MTPETMAGIHAASFTTPRAWSAAEFADLLRNPRVFVLTESGGFLLGRVVADEAEILTLAVAPQSRRTGIAKRLVAEFQTQARAAHATRAFLEVSAENRAAGMLYTEAGFVQGGLRRGYYRDPDGRAIDALVLWRDLL
jgi:[ribosomal protein S18]-alanine N-acetyltransferase